MTSTYFEGLPWFRMYTAAIDDEKLGLLAFEDRWHYVALLCCKGIGLLENPNDALFYRKIGLKMGLATRELEEVARRLSEVGLIERITLWPVSWDDRQMKSDLSTERVRAYRKRTKRPCNVSETAQDVDVDVDVDVDKNNTKGQNALPCWLPQQEWSDFLEMRRKIRKPMTNRAKALALKTLEGLKDHGYDVKLVMEQSIVNSWAAFYPLKNGSVGAIEVKGLEIKGYV